MSNIVPITRHIPAQQCAAHVSPHTTPAQNPVGDRRKTRNRDSSKRRCGDYATMEFTTQIIAQQLAEQGGTNNGAWLAMTYRDCTAQPADQGKTPVRLFISA